MILADRHRDRLINEAGIRPEIFEPLVFTAEKVSELPEEFRRWGTPLAPALVFKWFGAGGATLWQVNPDSKEVRKEVGKYLTIEGAVMPLGVHPTMVDKVADPEVELVIVEGTKQYLSATSALVGVGVAVVGITGCWGWSCHGLPVPDFHLIPWSGRSVVLSFDVDRSTNRQVWDGAKTLTEVVAARGAAQVRYLNLPATGTSGLDDYLATFDEGARAEAMIQLLGRATTKIGRAPGRSRPPRGRFFDDNGGLLVGDLAIQLRAEHPMALTGDNVIAVYDPPTGVYRKNPLLLAGVVGELLGNEFRRTHLRDVETLIAGQLAGVGLILPTTTTDPVINVANGMLDLVTGDLSAHDPAWLSHQQILVEWDEFAKCPRYEVWAAEIIGDVLDDLEEVASTMLDQSRTPAKALLLHGPTRSGKSTFLRLLEAVAGPQNVSAVSLHQLSEDRFASANLYGKMLNAAADISAEHVRDISLWKTLTGEDAVQANRKYGAQFTFTSTALMAFSCNVIPTVAEASRAYIERMKPFHFAHSYAGHEDRSIEAGMMHELPGILVRLVRANQRLRARGSYQATDPAEQRLFEDHSNRVRRWVREEMEIEPADTGAELPLAKALTKSELHRTFNMAAELDGERAIGKHKFLQHLANLPGVVEVRRLPDRTRALNIHRPGPEKDDRADPNCPTGNSGQGEKQPLTRDPGSSGSSNPPLRTMREEEGGLEVSDTSKGRVGSNCPDCPDCPTHPLVAFDLETASVDDLWSYGPGFVRLAGYLNGDGVAVTTDVTTIPAGATLVGHNIFGFDLLALARYHGLDLTTVSALDTKLLAFIADPPPAKLNEGQIERYYSLDSVGERLFGIGKEGDLKALAKEFGGFDRIPVDDGRYLDYLRRDVELTARIADAIPLTAYARREHEVARITAIMSISGFRVDESLLEARVRAGEATRAQMLQRLSGYGLPATRKDGSPVKAPQATEEGRAAIVAAFTDLGVELPPTPKGKPALGQKAMQWVCERHPRARSLAETIKSLNGVRTIYETITAHLVGDRVHPMINLRQATGRWSVTRPGLTVMGKRGGRHVERQVFLADEGEVLIAADLSQIDARAIAALSQDSAYLELFGPGRDAHREIAERVWGDAGRREEAKVITHGWSYGMGVEGIVRNTGVSMDTAMEFDRAMREQFPDLVNWRKDVREIARSGEMLDNGFGRMMRPDPDRAHTQGPALMGQGCARDLLMTGLLRLPTELLPMLRAVIHDEVVLSVPIEIVDDVERAVLEALCFDWVPPGGLLSVQVVAGLVGRGCNWGAVYEKKGST